MDWQRISILAAIAVVSVLLLNKWTEFTERTTVQAPVAVVESSNTTLTSDSEESHEDFVPTVAGEENQEVPEETVSGGQIHVATDILDLTIDLKGGDIVRADLLNHFDDLEEKQPFPLLSNKEGNVYLSQSGLIGRDGPDATGERPVYTAEASDYRLADNSDSLFVDLNYQQGEVTITKRFTFTRDDNAIAVEYIINNQSQAEWSGAMFGQIKRDDHSPVKTSGGMGPKPFLGGAFTTPEDHYKKFALKDLAEDGLQETSIQGGWVAMIQHYFVTAWIPPQESNNSFKLQKRGAYNFFTFTTASFAVPAGEKKGVKAIFYVGPKNVDRLESLAPYLDLTVDYGILWWIAKPLFHFLNFIHGFIGNWGWSIVLLTMTIKLVFFYPSAISYRSMAKMRKLQPLMADLKERLGDDRQKMSVELMKVYKKEGVNPMSGCLPILIQMPVFFSLYWMLMESVELRHAPFLGYITDLSMRDPYFILPVIMGITMFIQQRLQPAPPDPMQAKVMQFLPLVFTFMFLFFPAGLVVYWVVNNTLSILQQYVISRRIEKGSKA
ncbi:membrane protein insertase YidC [Halioxenophilus sp. WMMB6]|uniref:membrane protein insertase YidC n=1 Tax=Halioxenophilus sp. WMMB6 TaxID=3073815 RepID=UPI00295E6C61|nr:membrane protein insertase YidC [Halioxenophilus sp. WMMB6]